MSGPLRGLFVLPARAISARTDAIVGGPARRRVIVILAAVLALDAADKGALAATALQVEHYFDISKTQLGLLGSVSTAVAAATTLPFGLYVDRRTRTRLLASAIIAWSVAMTASGLATSYVFLLSARILLGAVTGVAYPAVASLIGDYFPVAERSKAYGWVLSGELVGTGLGVAIAGGAASWLGSWRAAEFVLVLPALFLAWRMWQFPEPARGGGSRMEVGQQRLLSAAAVASGARNGDRTRQRRPDAYQGRGLAGREVQRRHVPARDELILRRDPESMSLWSAVRYVLRVRTNIVVIAASALGYFFFSGVRFFGIQFAQEHYGLSHGGASAAIFVVGLGAVVGVILGGRLTDRLLQGRHVNARIVVPSITFPVTALLLAPAIWTSSVAFGLALMVPAALFFAASNPALDAARLDVMVPRLWGRAEATRTVFRGTLEALAPVAFGAVADHVFGNRHSGGLERTFLVMLVPLLCAGAVLLIGRRTYTRDVATADASARQASRRDVEPPW